MVDRQARDRAHDVLKKFKAGISTNDDFESDFPATNETGDAALHAIETMTWNYFNDDEVHKLEGQHALTPEANELFERMLAFLRSDEEYKWPISNFLGYGSSAFWNWVTLGIWNAVTNRQLAQRDALMRSAGDMDYWPFVSLEQYGRWKQQV